MSPIDPPAALEQQQQLSRPEGENYTEYYYADTEGAPHGPALIKTNMTDLRTAEREYHHGRLIWMKLYDPPSQALLRTMYYDEEMNPHGTWHQYDPTGTVLEEVSYDHGIKTGTESMYLTDGTLRFRATYKNGHMHGERVVLISRGYGTVPAVYDRLMYENGLSVSSLSVSAAESRQLPAHLFIPPGSRGDEEA